MSTLNTPGPEPSVDVFSPDVPKLLSRHLEQLRTGSGLSLEIIRERGPFSATSAAELRALGFSPAQLRFPALVLPVCTPDGGNGLYCIRPDIPRQDAKGKELKYELPRGRGVRLDAPPRVRPLLGDPSIPLWLTEGQKKADALADRGLCAVALLGVWNFKGRNEFGGVVLLSDFDYIALNGRTVNVVFDADIMVKRPVRDALDRLTEHLQRKGALVNPVYLPTAEDGSKVGVDDYLLGHSLEELEALVTAPRPAPKAAPPGVELLEDAPSGLGRPLALVDGRAYAAAWLWTRTTVAESIGKDGEVVRHDPPVVSTDRRLFVVRDDGAVYGGGGDQPPEALGLEVRLAEPPREGKGWRTAGVSRYRSGERPNPVDVFARLVSVYDRFIDFARSFADQRALCELSACFSLATWLAPAFSVLGYPWPNGERGSGKTHWGTCWAQTSYLGEVLLSSGSFAALRDLADYGATLLFDDAELIGDPKRGDPEKRELLLAGNRRGACIPVKEPASDRTWRTRWVNAYCPRGFTAIALPDAVLASRSIVIPLARTTDPARGNADPADVKRWPCDQQQLQDDLWALALWLLPEAEGVWAELDDETEATGREFEPWRGLIAVARLLERHSVTGLEGRLRSLMRDYRAEKADLMGADWTTLVIRGLLQLAGSDTSDARDADDTSGESVTLTSSQIAESAREIAKQEDREADTLTPSRVGRILKRFRVPKAPRTGKARGWKVSATFAQQLARAYGVPVTAEADANDDTSNFDVPESPILATSVIADTSVTSVTDEPDSRRGPEPPELLTLAEQWQWRRLVMAGRGEVGGGEERWRKLADFPPPWIGEVVETLRQLLADEEEVPF